MRFRTEQKWLSGEIDRLLGLDLRRSGEDTKFIVIKEEVLDILRISYGETSREFRVVKLTSSPATVVKVLNHIAGRTDVIARINIAANM